MPEKVQQRRFAVEVVRRLRGRGYEAYWAGGCVRDELLGLTPKDYDVATSATPAQVRKVFGHRRTLAVGAAFGVITVLGPRAAGSVEVATFRRDAQYSDGRHPDHVTFSSAEEDAARRDFTINGLFYDPLARRVIDFVGGREDLKTRVIRAIGPPRERFAEDKLRMLRALRFSITFDFRLHEETFQAICEMAPQITVVSAERIAMEMRRMLVEPRRADAVVLLLQTGLAESLLPEIVAQGDDPEGRLAHTLETLKRLPQPGFPLAFAALLHDCVEAQAARHICTRFRLSNKETQRVVWLVEHQAALREARRQPWSRLQPVLVSEAGEDLLALCEAAWPERADEVAYCRTLLKQPAEVLDPPPLVTGDTLMAQGVPPGPDYQFLLQEVRNAQLDKRIATQAEALALVDQLRAARQAGKQTPSRKRR